MNKATEFGYPKISHGANYLFLNNMFVNFCVPGRRCQMRIHLRSKFLQFFIIKPRDFMKK